MTFIFGFFAPEGTQVPEDIRKMQKKFFAQYGHLKLWESWLNFTYENLRNFFGADVVSHQLARKAKFPVKKKWRPLFQKGGPCHDL